MPFKNGTKLCICEICNCGRHRCPHHPHVRAPTGQCSISEYTNKYVPHPLYPVASCKPAAVASHSKDPLSDETTTRVDYIPHALGGRPQPHQAEAYKPPQGLMEGDTVYSTTYTEKRAPRAMPIKHDAARKELGRFEGEPTYRNDYKRWPLSKPERAHTVMTWHPPRDKFEGLPTYVSDYIGHKGGPQASCRPKQEAMHSDSPFDDMTDYRHSYVKHPLDRPMSLKPAYTRTGALAPFDGLTTHARDFTPKEGGRSGSCKPLASAYQSGEPLASDTTMRVDYRPWELSRPFHHQPDEYRPPQGEIDSDTTYLRDYPQHPLARRTDVRPKERAKELGPFQGTTDYRDSYQRWKVAGRLPSGPQTVYRAPNVPFEGQSTHQAHYIEHPLDPRKSCKPNARGHTPSGDFDDNTIYRMEYTPKHTEPCPAALLETPRSRFVYREIDNTTGHKFFEPLRRASISVGDLRGINNSSTPQPIAVAAS